MSDGPHILIATGGSGGHLYPAFAVADEIERRWPGCEVRLTTGDRPIEADICRSAGRIATRLPLVPSSKARRHPLRFLKGLWAARREANHLIADIHADCVVGAGGLAMSPVIQAALGRRIPVVLLEQNAIAGRATRWFARRASAICSSFERLEPRLKTARIEQTGNPVRASIAKLFAESRPEGGHLLVLGGSQGARALNEALAWIAQHQPAILVEHEIVHQTGGTESARELEAVYHSVGLRARVAPFIDDVAPLYSRASLLIARAGATTLAEAACAGVPAILVPYPFARDRHQHANAAVFEQAGAARVIEQTGNTEGDGRHLARVVEELLQSNGPREQMSRGMRSLARPDAARHVVDVIERAIATPI
ncbi:MAG TPA: UDP-N-acetylglucosamine--N-acetylmuramyl-(pentapeptide) pyrophosphoryl-undecaprenol N-acetylglucosamine transferase [Caulifigura sp.]|nr:UDP-N-acetylglucosamine--N-acetylmuramyl-(pentapeptide) pyrophosphoryl-undecaprenol N-acetylglucosamine transferase [Caulifigura sp.]